MSAAETHNNLPPLMTVKAAGKFPVLRERLNSRTIA